MLARAASETMLRKSKARLVREEQWPTDLTLCCFHATLKHLPWGLTRPPASCNLWRATKPPRVSVSQSVSQGQGSCPASGWIFHAVMNTQGENEENASQAGIAHV